MQYAIERQLSIAIENEPGRLAAIARAMAAHGINIQDISVIDTIEQGVIRLVTSDAAACRRVLSELGLYVVEAEVLVVDLPDSPGMLGSLSQTLADARINIDYAYGSVGPGARQGRLVLKVSNLARASEVLQSFEPR